MPLGPQPTNAVCPEKITLLRDYVSQLHLHNEDVRDYAQYVISGLDGDGLTTRKKRLEESKIGLRITVPTAAGDVVSIWH